MNNEVDLNYDNELRRRIMDVNNKINELEAGHDYEYYRKIRRFKDDTYEYFYSYHYKCSDLTVQAAKDCFYNSSITFRILEDLYTVIDNGFDLKTNIGALNDLINETVSSGIRYYYPNLYKSIIEVANKYKDNFINDLENLEKEKEEKKAYTFDEKIDVIDKIDTGNDLNEMFVEKPDKKIDHIDNIEDIDEMLNDGLDKKIDSHKPSIRVKFM